jgi:LysM repeat protein
MHARGRPSLARLLAPLALILSVVAVLAMVLGSGVVGDDGDESETARTTDPTTETQTTTTRNRQRQRTPATYTIQANDTLSGIAEANNTTVERLQELNPEIDPQGLVAGQKIKLRE